MFKNICVSSACISLSLIAVQANACMEHYAYGGGYNSGFFSGSKAPARVKFQPAKKKVFKVQHAPAAVVKIDEDSNLEISYDLPQTSKNVSLQLEATDNVELLDQDIQLTELNGTANARFRVKEKGLDTITVTVSGEYEGEVLTYSSKVYVNARLTTAS